MTRSLLFPVILYVIIGSAAMAEDSGTVHITGNLLASACSITSGNDLTFDLDTALTTDLPNVNSVSGRQEQNIQLSCDSDTLVYMTINGDTESNDNTILKNTGTAQGVGVQLLDVSNNNTPIEEGVRWTLISDSGTTETIPIAAQYIRTSDLVSGTVEANATYTLDYE